ncbi:Uncharacterised protein [uncultured archaeon]|nr:Uncharacterised protein [uncultured archaeon]
MLAQLFSFLLLISLICLVAGLIKPSIFKRFIKRDLTRKQVGAIFGIAFVVCFIAVGATAPETTPKPQAEHAEQVKTISQTTPKTEIKTIDYQIIKRWQIPNGGEGKVVLIPKDYVNDADMTAIGQKLKKDTAKDRNAVIEVFSDRQAALLRDKVFNNTATGEETDLYDKNYVGSYTRNINTGYNKFEIFFDGVMGTNNKTITY